MSTVLKVVSSFESRSCGSCTACCKTFAINSPELVKPAGEWCKHCDKGRGCANYNNRPESCRAFVCEWRKGRGEEKHRPDRVKVVLDYWNPPDAVPGGILQIWELIEGSLAHAYAKEVTRQTLAGGIWVSHINLRAHRTKIFRPPSRELSDPIMRSIKNAGMELCSPDKL
jgi:Fe-S-cluster containining protein